MAFSHMRQQFNAYHNESLYADLRRWQINITCGNFFQSNIQP